MSIKIGVVMDDIASIKTYKDSTFAMMLEAQARAWSVFYMQQSDLSLRDDQAFGRMTPVQIEDNQDSYYQLGETIEAPLSDLHVILMRKDPPFDVDYFYSTLILQQAHDNGVLVVNNPRALRDGNEKLLITRFPDCIGPTLVSSNSKEIKQFLLQHKDIVVKPLDAMGGASIFRVKHKDLNTNVIIETLTHNGSRLMMAQRFIPEISRGDKRILMVDAKPVPYALARIPPDDDLRGNLAVGGRGEGVELCKRDFWICEQVAPYLKENGLMFVGLDVIGDYLTEINITSPTCIRELDGIYDLNISEQLMDAIETKVTH